jgi:hypothetical protein
LATGGVFLLGQEQDIIDGAFDENQAFSGRVTEVEMWKTVLSQRSILNLAKCLNEESTLEQVNNWIKKVKYQKYHKLH